jgi:hypothetical protein
MAAPAFWGPQMATAKRVGYIRQRVAVIAQAVRRMSGPLMATAAHLGYIRHEVAVITQSGRA